MSGFWQQLTVGRHQFSRPPMRSYHFWVETLFLLMVASEAVFLTVFFKLRLSWQTIFNMTFPVVMLAVVWFGILRAHQAIYEANRSKWESSRNESEEDPRVDILLNKLAYLSYAGFNYGAVAVAVAYIGFLPSSGFLH